MAITLDGITLPDLVIGNEFAETKVRSVVAESLGGKPIIWETSRSMRLLDLIGGDDFGWIERSVLVSLRARADVVGATYDLVYESDTYTVRFRNEDTPAIEAEPIIPRPNHAAGDYYNNVRLKLMIITISSSSSSSSSSLSSSSSSRSSSSSSESSSSSSSSQSSSSSSSSA